MVKQTQKTKKPKAQRTVVRSSSKQSKARKPGNGLDASAIAYARLLANPCSEILAHPVYGGTEGGYLLRCEAFLNIGTAAGITAGTLQWCPGLMGPNNTEILYTQCSGPTVADTATVYSGAPGKAFLSTTASNIRCVAACMKVSYPGAELDRSGRLHFGGCSGSMIDAGQVLTPDQLSSSLEHYTRTPAGEIEIVWKPNSADQMFTDPSVANASIEKDRKSAIAFAFAGLKSAVGLNIRFTAVYEWQPAINQGLAVPNTSRSLSNNSLDQVVNAVQATGFKFIRGVASEATMGVAGGIMRMAGAIQSTRSGLLTY